MASEPDPRPDAADLLAEAGFLRRLATELVGLPHDADDLVQETYVRALKHAPQRSTSLRGWLSVVARNLAFNSSRGQRRRDEHERRAARPEALEPGDIALEKFEQQQRLFELVLSLPEEQRTVLYLRYYEGLTPTEIAQRLCAPLKTVKTRQTRALAALRERLDARNGGDGKSWRLALTPLVPLSPAPTAGSLLTTLLGGIVVKKTLTVAAVVLLALVSWFGWRRIADAHPEPSHSVALAEPAQVSPPPSAAPLSAEVLAQREELAPSAAPASATPAVGRAEITLLWSDGTPAIGVGATMRLARPRGTPEQRARGTSDATGLLVLDGLVTGRNRLAIDLRDIRWLEVPTDAPLRTTITLAKGEQVRGRVLDQDGQPIAGAGIVCEHGEGWTPEVSVLARTDALGQFVLRDVSADSEVGARAAGFLPSPQFRVKDLQSLWSVRRIEFQLERGLARLSGRVFAPDGTPLAEARVLAGPRNGHNVPGPLGGKAVAPQPLAATSSADGRFEIEDALPVGLQPVHCFARGFAPWSSELELTNSGAELEIQLEAAARIEGRVVDADGAPVAGAEVVQAVEFRGGWFNSDAFPPPKDVTDANGWFVLDWVGSGTRELNASDPKRSELGRAHSTVTCRPGETTQCELRLERGRVITGRVVDESGAPLAGWHVGSKPSDFLMNQWYSRSDNADADGRFVLANLGPGTHDITVRTPKLSAPRLVVPEVAPGTTDLELVVTGARATESELAGRIVASSADSLAGLELTLWRAGQNEGRFLEYDPKTGQFRGRAFPGNYRVDVTRNGASVAEIPPFELLVDQPKELGDVPLGDLGSIEIEFTGLPPETLAALEPDLVRPGSRQISLRNVKGRASASDVLAGKWELRQWDDELELSPSEIVIQPGAPTRVQVEVRPKRR